MAGSGRTTLPRGAPAPLRRRSSSSLSSRGAREVLHRPARGVAAGAGRPGCGRVSNGVSPTADLQPRPSPRPFQPFTGGRRSLFRRTARGSLPSRGPGALPPRARRRTSVLGAALGFLGVANLGLPPGRAGGFPSSPQRGRSRTTPPRGRFCSCAGCAAAAEEPASEGCGGIGRCSAGRAAGVAATA